MRVVDVYCPTCNAMPGIRCISRGSIVRWTHRTRRNNLAVLVATPVNGGGLGGADEGERSRFFRGVL